MTLKASGMLKSGVNIQYLYMMVREEALCQFDKLSDEIGISTPENLMSIILGLVTYFYHVNALSKQKCVMRCRTSNCGLKVKRYVDFMIDINKYLAVFPGAKKCKKNCMM